jgi:hypothetical protein
LAFFDDDEIAPPGWLTALVNARERFPDAVCIGGPYQVRFEASPSMCPGCWPGEAGFDLGPEERYVHDVAAGNMIVVRAAFEIAGEFDESLQGRGDETEWMSRLGDAGQRVAYSPAAWVWHRRTSDQLRLRRCVQRSFSMGRQECRFLTKTGQPPRIIDGGWRAALVPRLIGHAVTRRCAGGMGQAAAALGFLTETMRSHIHHGVTRVSIT